MGRPLKKKNDSYSLPAAIKIRLILAPEFKF